MPYKCQMCEKRRLAKSAYKKTPKGFLMRRWVKMKNRLKNKYSGRGLELLPIKEFYEWALSDTVFMEMYLRWKDSGMELWLTPTVDRIDNTKGYILGNMQWLTFIDNTRKARDEGKKGMARWKEMNRKKKLAK